MKTSAGIAIIWNNKILMAQPNNAKDWERYTPPKGGIEEGETIAQAASRETFEEIGIYIAPHKLLESNMTTIIYDNRKSGVVYKTVHIFEYHISSLSEINIKSETLPKRMLQSNEIGEAHFMGYEECKKKALKRYLNYIKNLINQ